MLKLTKEISQGLAKIITKKIFSEIESDQYLMKWYAKKEIKPVIDSAYDIKITSPRPGLSNRDMYYENLSYS